MRLSSRIRKSVKRPLACAVLVVLWAAIPAEANWTAPQDLSSQSDDSYSPTAAVDANGDAAVVWYLSLDSYRSAIETSLRNGSGSFGPAVRIDSGSWLSTDPHVVMSSTGEAIAVFSQETGSSVYNTWAAIRAPGKDFAAPEQLNDQSTGLSNDYNPGVGMDSAGDALAFWYQNSQDQIYWTLRPAGGSFGPPHAISNPADYLQNPDYAVGGNGDAVVTWGSYGTVYAALRPAGHDFGPGVALNSTDDARFPPRVAMDGQGNAIATWMTCTDPCSSPKIEYAVRPSGGTFGSPITLAVGTMEAYVPVVAMDQQGDAVIAWGGGATDPPFASAGITAMIRPPGGSFGPPEDIDPNGSYEDPQLAWDDQGNLFASWRRYQGGSEQGRAIAAMRPAGGHFSGQEDTLSDTDKNVWPTALAAAGNRQALVAWPIGYFNGNASTFWIQESNWSDVGASPPPPPPPGSDGTGTSTSNTAGVTADTATQPSLGLAGGPRLDGPPPPASTVPGSTFRASLNAPADVEPRVVRRRGLSFTVRCSEACGVRTIVLDGSHRVRVVRGVLHRAGRIRLRASLPLRIVHTASRGEPVRLELKVVASHGAERRTLTAPVTVDRGSPFRLGPGLGRTG